MESGPILIGSRAPLVSIRFRWRVFGEVMGMYEFYGIEFQSAFAGECLERRVRTSNSGEHVPFQSAFAGECLESCD